MTYKILKTATYLSLVFFVSLLSGCLKKNDATYLDFSQLEDHVILRSSGISGFKAANLRIDATSTTPDSVQIYAELASVNASSSDVKITIGADNGQIAAYNAANNTHFEAFPAGSYKILNASPTIAAGDHYTSTYVVLDQTKFDPAISYMLPVSITDGGGKALTTNQNTIFFNIIGNPIAGVYTQEWIRFNNAAGTGDPAFDQTFDGVFSAVNPTTISADSGTGVTYLLSFTNTNGVLSNFQISLDPASVTTAGITISNGPTIVLADPVNKKYEFNFQYVNSAGSGRNITDKFTK